MRPRKRLWCFVLLLVLAGPVAPVHAAEGAWSGPGHFWAWLESWLLWSEETADQCSSIDPNGRCGGGGSATSEQGPWIDPDGGASATSEQGSSIDPNG